MGNVPKVVTKWLPKSLRSYIEKHRVCCTTSENKIFAIIDVWSEGSTTVANLVTNYPAKHVSQKLDVLVKNIKTDWLELAELAAWVIGMDDKNRTNTVQQAVSKLGDSHYIYLCQTHCKIYQRHDGRASDELLRTVKF